MEEPPAWFIQGTAIFLGISISKSLLPPPLHPSGLSLREAAGPRRGYQAFGRAVMVPLHPGHFTREKAGCVFIWGSLGPVFPLPCCSFKGKSVLFVRARCCGAGSAAEGCSARSAARQGSACRDGGNPKEKAPQISFFFPLLFTTQEPSGSSGSPGGPGCGGAHPGLSRRPWAAELQG